MASCPERAPACAPLPGHGISTPPSAVRLLFLVDALSVVANVQLDWREASLPKAVVLILRMTCGREGGSWNSLLPCGEEIPLSAPVAGPVG